MSNRARATRAASASLQAAGAERDTDRRTLFPSSAQDQSLSLQQVNTAVNQLDQVTQENAAMVEQATAATRTLATQTQDLQAQVARFQTGGSPASVYSTLSTREQASFSTAANDDRFEKRQAAAPAVSSGYAMNGTTGAPATFSSGASDDGWEEF